MSFVNVCERVFIALGQRRRYARRVVLAALALASVLPSATYAYDLFGNDIGGIDVGDVEECADACLATPGCQAWTFVRAGNLSVSARCFFKNPVPEPSFNSTCTDNFDCLSGYADPSWCGDRLQGEVLACPTTACSPRRSTSCSGWWIFRTCTTIQTTDYFCD